MAKVEPAQATPAGIASGIVVPGQHVDGLASCCNDKKVCLAVCCCSFITTGQLYERVTGSKGSCIKIAALIGLCFLVQMALSSRCTVIKESVYYTEAGPVRIQETTFSNDPVCTVFNVSGFVAAVTILFVLTKVRTLVRAKYNIPPTCCGSCDDICCACCCGPFVQCQLFRHLGTMENSKYALQSPTGVLAV